jgi:RNA polymerase sigma-70 factor (ECF subfamily)
MNFHSDDELVSSITRGCEQALPALMERHWKWVYSLMKAYVRDNQVAEELAQDAFHRVYQKAEKYTVGTNFVAWLRQIATNIVKNHLRRNKTVALLPLSELAESLEGDERFDPVKALHSNLLQEEMRNAIELLPDKQRLSLVMYYFGCMDLKEIAWALKCPVGTVKSRIFYALKGVRETLKDIRYND